MAKSLNLCQFIGNLGKDPETKYTQSGIPVSTFSLATTVSYKKGEQWEERTEWINVKCWARLAEIAAEYLHKGSKIYIAGRMETQSWEKDGHKNYKTEIVVSDLLMLDGKQSGDHDRSDSRGSDSRGSGGRSRNNNDFETRRNTNGGDDDGRGGPITDEDVPF